MSTESPDKRPQVEEDLATGPTPETRRDTGEQEDTHDTSEGPTPETREAERLASER